MPIFLTRTLPAALILIVAGLGGFFAHGYLARPRMVIAAGSPVAAQLAGTTAASANARAATSGATSAAGGPAPELIPQALPDVAFEDRAGAEVSGAQGTGQSQRAGSRIGKAIPCW